MADRNHVDRSAWKRRDSYPVLGSVADADFPECLRWRADESAFSPDTRMGMRTVSSSLLDNCTLAVLVI
ncbi:MAG: hypothetical protein U1E53_14100 [Dongiaceae bacterium]